MQKKILYNLREKKFLDESSRLRKNEKNVKINDTHLFENQF